MSLNVKHLRKIQKHIRKDANRLCMGDWEKQHLQPGQPVYDGSCYNYVGQVAPECGTVACIAGWSALLRGRGTCVVFQERFFLGLPSNRLFYVSSWPEDLSLGYQYATTVQEKTDIACEAIDRVIASGGEFCDSNPDPVLSS